MSQKDFAVAILYSSRVISEVRKTGDEVGICNSRSQSFIHQGLFPKSLLQPSVGPMEMAEAYVAILYSSRVISEDLRRLFEKEIIKKGSQSFIHQGLFPKLVSYYNPTI